MNQKHIDELKTQIGWKDDEITSGLVAYIVLRDNVDSFSLSVVKFANEKTVKRMSAKTHILTNDELKELFENGSIDSAQFGILSKSAIKKLHAESKVKKNSRTRKTA